jgi:hypothetical protein
MSSAVSTLCLFTAALCNVGNLDQNVFGSPETQENLNQFVNAGSNLFNQGAQSLGLGGISLNFGGNNVNNNKNKNKNQKIKPPHDSPCPGKFRYVSNNQQWKGLLKFPNINPDGVTNVHADFILPRNVNQEVISVFSSFKKLVSIVHFSFSSIYSQPASKWKN